MGQIHLICSSKERTNAVSPKWFYLILVFLSQSKPFYFSFRDIFYIYMTERTWKFHNIGEHLKPYSHISIPRSLASKQIKEYFLLSYFSPLSQSFSLDRLFVCSIDCNVCNQELPREQDQRILPNWRSLSLWPHMIQYYKISNLQHSQLFSLSVLRPNQICSDKINTNIHSPKLEPILILIL